jgi:hypothetical protein
MCGAPSICVVSSQEMVRSVGRSRARVIAAALIAYGLAGIVVLGALAIAVLPMTNTIDTIARSSADVSEALASTRDAFDGFGASLTEAQRSAERAAVAARSSSQAASQLANGMSLSIFGAQPLLSLATGFRQQSDDLAALAAELDALAVSLSRNGDDVRELRTDVATLHTRATSLGTSSTGPSWLVPALLVLFVWMAVPPLVALVGGLLLLRASTGRRAGRHASAPQRA